MKSKEVLAVPGERFLDNSGGFWAPSRLDLTIAPKSRCRSKTKFTVLCTAAAVLCWSASLVLAVEPTPESHSRAEPLTDTERRALESQIQQLQEQLGALRHQPTVTPDLWADAHVFIKGLIWALDFGPISSAKDRALMERGVARAQERIDRLRAGEPEWRAKKGRVMRGFVSEVDGSTQPYLVMIPANYDAAKPMRLDVVLHGSMRSNGIRELEFILEGDGGDSDGGKAPDANYLELRPLGRLGENAYRFEGETDVDEAIAAVCRNYRVDPTRIVLRGHSLGGVGTWQLGLKRPDRYVAIGPSGGPVDTYEFANAAWPHFVRLEPLTAWQKKLLHLVDAVDYAANAVMVPVVAVMGEKDPYFSSHLLIQRAFAKEGVPFNGFTDYGAKHGISLQARQNQVQILGMYAAKGLESPPRQIRFVSWTLKFSRCHWIELLGLKEHYLRAEINARQDDDGTVNITSLTNVTRFAIHLPASQGESARVIVEGKEVTLPAGGANVARTVVVGQIGGSWLCLGDRDEVPLPGKRPGLQGPIDDAFASPFLCVRGTGKAWNAAAATWSEASLKRFADEWRRHYRGDLRVKNDTDVTADDLRRFNLILFGDPGSNRWIGDVLPKLPIRWTADEIALGPKCYRSADHGLQMIYPNPLLGAEGRYVVLNSGHTYHDEELRFSYMIFPRLGDWAIVKFGEKSAEAPAARFFAETVLESGFFDEAWERPLFVAETGR